mgnify:CR=1 FL=1|tara:strand:- start:2371 stop:3591 length:1221 start_codon:yes stop_codon:yes gene_type:complete
MKRTVILMLDSFGIGAAEDAAYFGDAGSNTFGHIAKFYAEKALGQGPRGALHLPHLARLGLAHAAYEATGSFPLGFCPELAVEGTYGYAGQLSTGKDTPSGHWEMAGVPVLFDWGYFTEKTNSFPQVVLDRIFERSAYDKSLGNCHASGTDILQQLGDEHIQTGLPIFYTSSDSVFQVACHEDHFGLENLYTLCEIVRQELEPYNIGRVIARPFVGSKETGFERTGNRRDYAVLPPEVTVLDKLKESGGHVVSIGKISDIYAGSGITKQVKATGLEELFNKTLDELECASDRTLVFTNFVDFDSHYGHRRDVIGYGQALEYFDRRLPELLSRLQEDDLLLITADHGCDPTWKGTDHTREYVPVLALGAGLKSGSIGKRETFADMGQTISDYFNLEAMNYGQSFLFK